MIVLARRRDTHTRPTHMALEPFYIFLRRQENPALRKNYTSELHQVMILHLSRAGLTSWI